MLHHLFFIPHSMRNAVRAASGCGCQSSRGSRTMSHRDCSTCTHARTHACTRTSYIHTHTQAASEQQDAAVSPAGGAGPRAMGTAAHVHTHTYEHMNIQTHTSIYTGSVSAAGCGRQSSRGSRATSHGDCSTGGASLNTTVSVWSLQHTAQLRGASEGGDKAEEQQQQQQGAGRSSSGPASGGGQKFFFYFKFPGHVKEFALNCWIP